MGIEPYPCSEKVSDKCDEYTKNEYWIDPPEAQEQIVLQAISTHKIAAHADVVNTEAGQQEEADYRLMRISRQQIYDDRMGISEYLSISEYLNDMGNDHIYRTQTPCSLDSSNLCRLARM